MVTTASLVPRTKTDVAGEGRTAYLSPDTARLLREWIGEAGLGSGPLFRSLHLHRVADGPLSSIRRLIKRATERAGLEPALTADLSGHSMRIGAAQDMMVAGFDALAIMQAGGKSVNVVLRYVEHASARQLHERRWQAGKLVEVAGAIDDSALGSVRCPAAAVEAERWTQVHDLAG